MNNTLNDLKNENGLIKMIRMGKSIRHKWVKEQNKHSYSRTHKKDKSMF